MNSLFSNRFANAFAKTLVVFGCLHILILNFVALRGDVEALNAFQILSLEILIPALRHGLGNFLLSYSVVLVVYCLVYRFLTNRPKEDDLQSLR